MLKSLTLKAKFPIKTRDIHKIERKNSGGSIFGHENKVGYPIYISKKCCEDKHADLLLIGERKKALCFYQRFQCIHI